MDYIEWLPKDKHDNSHIDDLLSLSENEIEPLLDGLLMWIQDLNWPVAIEVIKVLVKNQNLIISRIIILLDKSNRDAVWKEWILSMISLFSNENRMKLKPYIFRIINDPTEEEILEGLESDIKFYFEEWF